MRRTIFSILVMTVVLPCAAFSPGSPVCEVATLPLIPMSPTLSSPPPTGWSLRTLNSVYRPGERVQWQIRNTDPSKRVKGVLLWAKTGSGGVGSFLIPSGKLFQHIPPPSGCDSWALTHTSAQSKGQEVLNFTWEAPTDTAPFAFFRAFLIEDCGATSDCRSYQALTPIVELEPALFSDGFETR